MNLLTSRLSNTALYRETKARSTLHVLEFAMAVGLGASRAGCAGHMCAGTDRVATLLSSAYTLNFVGDIGDHVDVEMSAANRRQLSAEVT